jgi:hypothetical protein
MSSALARCWAHRIAITCTETICATSMASTASRGLMLCTIDIMNRVGTSAAHAGPDQLPDQALHRVAIGDPELLRHQLFAARGIRMIDGKSLRRENEARRIDGLALRGCGDR